MGILLKSLLFVFALNVSASAEENVFSCSERGDLTHSFVKTSDGYKLYVNYGMYFIRPAYNPETGGADGQGSIGIDVPIDDGNIRTTSLRWINEKAEFFSELFPDTLLPVQNSVETGKLELDFSNKDCELVEKEGFIFASCRANGPFEINGVRIENIDFTMQNQIRTTLLNDPYSSELQVSDLEVVYASLSFHKRRGAGTYIYRSSTTYYPDEEETECSKRQQ